MTSGGLISYGPNTVEEFRNAAGYVDRILKGEKPADLPVQAPTRYELAINLKTAKALGLDRAADAARARRRGDRVKRRQFISLLGGAAAVWSGRAWGQQVGMPVVGLVHPQSVERYVDMIGGFRQGLSEVGYIEGQNVAVEYRWGNNQIDRLPALYADLVRRRIAVIVSTGGAASALAAKAATSTIPIVVAFGSDPVELGLIDSLNRPGGNITGASFITRELEAKRLGLLCELVPQAMTVAYLYDPRHPLAERRMNEMLSAARALGRRIVALEARNERDFEGNFETLVRNSAGALQVQAAPLFTNYRETLSALAARHRIPAIYQFREFVADGGLMSYGASQGDTLRLGGNYVGRILKGQKPADLPFQQSSKFEFVINLKTAKALGLTVPPMLLARADEVIE